jgi:hypothetical protein
MGERARRRERTREAVRPRRGQMEGGGWRIKCGGAERGKGMRQVWGLWIEVTDGTEGTKDIEETKTQRKTWAGTAREGRLLTAIEGVCGQAVREASAGSQDAPCVCVCVFVCVCVCVCVRARAPPPAPGGACVRACAHKAHRFACGGGGVGGGAAGEGRLEGLLPPRLRLPPPCPYPHVSGTRTLCPHPHV